MARNKTNLEQFEEALKTNKMDEALGALKSAIDRGELKEINKRNLLSNGTMLDRVLESLDNLVQKSKRLYAAEEFLGDASYSAGVYDKLNRIKGQFQSAYKIISALKKEGATFKKKEHENAYKFFLENDTVAGQKITQDASDNFYRVRGGVQSLLEGHKDVDKKKLKADLHRLAKDYRTGVFTDTAQVNEVRALFAAVGMDDALKKSSELSLFQRFWMHVTKLPFSSRIDNAVDKLVSQSEKYNTEALFTRQDDLDKKIKEAETGLRKAQQAVSSLDEEKKHARMDLKGHPSSKRGVESSLAKLNKKLSVDGVLSGLQNRKVQELGKVEAKYQNQEKKDMARVKLKNAKEGIDLLESIRDTKANELAILMADKEKLLADMKKSQQLHKSVNGEDNRDLQGSIEKLNEDLKSYNSSVRSTGEDHLHRTQTANMRVVGHKANLVVKQAGKALATSLKPSEATKSKVTSFAQNAKRLISKVLNRKGKGGGVSRD